jgi:hypothetical protein
MLTSRNIRQRASSSVLGGMPSRKRPKPSTISHNVIRQIVMVASPARNFPSSSASR